MAKRIASNLYGGADERYFEASGVATDAVPYERYTGFKLRYQDFDDADTAEAVILGNLPAGAVVSDVAVKVINEFGAAVALTSAKLDLGFSDGGTELLNGLLGLDETSAPTANQFVNTRRARLGKTPTWVKYTIAYSDFSDADTAETLTLDTLPAGVNIHDLRLKLNTKFDATVTLTAATLEVGAAADIDGLVEGWADLDDDGGTAGWQVVATYNAYGDDLFNPAIGAVDGESVLVPANYAAATALTVTLTVAGDNLNDMTQGSMDLYVLMSQPDGPDALDVSGSDRVIYATLTVAGDNLADMDEGEIHIFIKTAQIDAGKVFRAGDGAVYTA